MDSDVIDLSFLNNIDPIPLIPDKGVIKYLIKPGDPLTKPLQKGYKAYIKLEGRKIDGSALDKNKNIDEIRKINLFSDKYVEGIHIAVASMHKNEISWFKIEPKYHFFSSGDISSIDDPQSINKKEALLYKIEMTDFKSTVLDPLDFEGRIERFEESRNKGKELFSIGKYIEACEIYMNSIKMIRNFPNNLRESLNETQKKQMKNYSEILFSNASLCKIKNKSWFEALKLCEEGLKITPLHVKLLYRKAQCHMGLYEFSQAIEIFEKVIELEPENTEAVHQKKLCEEKEIEEKIKEKKKYQKLFEKMPEEEQKEKMEKKKKEFLEENQIKKEEKDIENENQENEKKRVTLEDLEKGIIIDANDPNNIFVNENAQNNNIEVELEEKN